MKSLTAQSRISNFYEALASKFESAGVWCGLGTLVHFGASVVGCLPRAQSDVLKVARHILSEHNKHLFTPAYLQWQI